MITPVMQGMRLVYLPRLGVWRRYHPTGWPESFFHDVDDFRLGNEDDVLMRWIPRPNGDRSGYKVCWVLQSFVVVLFLNTIYIVVCSFLQIMNRHKICCELENYKSASTDHSASRPNKRYISRRTFILVPLNKSCSSIACSSQAMCLDLSDFLSALAAAAAPVLEVFDDPSSRGCLRIGCTVSAGGILMFVESIVAVLSINYRVYS